MNGVLLVILTTRRKQWKIRARRRPQPEGADRDFGPDAGARRPADAGRSGPRLRDRDR